MDVEQNKRQNSNICAKNIIEDRDNRLRCKPRDKPKDSSSTQFNSTKRSLHLAHELVDTGTPPFKQDPDDQRSHRRTAKKFSSRNSLRSAQIANTTDTIDDRIKCSEMQNFNERDVANYLTKMDTYNYARLKTDCFIREIGDFCYCLLCGKRERKISGSNTKQKHIKSDFHSDNYRKLKNLLVGQIPDEDSFISDVTSRLLGKWYEENFLTDELFARRMSSVHDFQIVLAEINPECHFRLSGSYSNHTALKSSNINLELFHPNSKLFESDPRAKDSIHHKLIDPSAPFGKQFNNHITHYDLITNTSDILYKTACTIHQRCSSISAFTVLSTVGDLSDKVPKLTLRHQPTDTILEISCRSETNFKLSQLIEIYLSLDRRAAPLAIIIKHWAKTCKISDPAHGTLAPTTYIILMIHFLQRTQPPVLPCLHEILNEYSKMTNVTSNGVEDNLSRQFQQKLGLSNLRETSSKQENNEFTDDLDCNDKRSDNCDEESQEKCERDLLKMQEFIQDYNWKSENISPVHLLFLEFLKFMSFEFSDVSEVISIRTLKSIGLASKHWTTQVKAIEHPLKPNKNILRCIGSKRTFFYIMDSFAHTFYYLTTIPMDNQLRIINEYKSDSRDYARLYVNLNRLDFYFNMREHAIVNHNKFNPIDEMIRQKVFARDVEVINKLIEFGSSQGSIHSLPAHLSTMFRTSLMLPEDSTATLFCKLCKRNGHLKNACPSWKIEKLEEKRLYNADYLDSKVNLDDSLWELYANDLITPRLSRLHQSILMELRRIISLELGYDCNLQLFGSTVNCLGSIDSDLDICMTVDDNINGQGLDIVKILAIVEGILNQLKEVTNMEPRLTARVPILKFQYKKLNIDLSMYNMCALYNSRLIKTYVLVDHRVAKLFYLVKRYAKGCGIADASRGSLSSYAWSLMVIHFLQQISPPILPILQETDKNTPRPRYGVDGWDVWFNEDLDSIVMPRNELTLTQLFKMFLYYYASFDFSIYVVSIRTSRLLTKFQKKWNDCMMAIEDPFELTYNLSGRLDDPMAIYVMNSFARTYKHIVKFQENLSRRKITKKIETNTIEKIFDGRLIMNSDPPRRGCRICFKIGHRVKDCPEAALKKKPPHKRD